jgi:hypothetical protein
MTESEADGTESHPNLDAPSPNNENGDRRETQAEEPPALQGDMTDSRDADEASRLQALEAHVRDQGDLERDIEIQVGLNAHFRRLVGSSLQDLTCDWHQRPISS